MTNPISTVPQSQWGNTFDVHDVEIAADLLPTGKTNVAVEQFLEFPIHACCDYTDNCILDLSTNPLVTAVSFAYAQHRPLAISPDTIWLTILHGLNDHLTFSQGKYDKLLLGPQARERNLTFVSPIDFPTTSPEAPWDEVVDQATRNSSELIRPEFRELFELQFSTTQKADRIAKRIAFLSTIKKFTRFLDGWICGIPQITVEGNEDDWIRMRVAVEELQVFEFDWWLEHIKEILDEFVLAIQKRPNRSFWRKIYAREESNSCHKEAVSGWIGKLFPYECRKDAPEEKNRLLKSGYSGVVWLTSFPKGVKEVCLELRDRTKVRLFGGFIGISQDNRTLALRPKIGWSVRKQNSFENLLERLAASTRVDSSPANAEFNSGQSKKLDTFYDRFERMTIFGRNGDVLVRFLSPTEIRKWRNWYDRGYISWEELRQKRHQLMTFAQLWDGRYLASAAFNSGNPPYQFNAFFIVGGDNSDFAELISDDFEEVLSWLYCERQTPLANHPKFRVLGKVRVHDLNVYDINDPGVSLILKLLPSNGRSDAIFCWD